MKATEHFHLLERGFVDRLSRLFRNKALSLGNSGLRDHLEKGSRSNFYKAGGVVARESRTAFRDVGGDGNGCTAHLARQAEAFSIRKGFCGGVYQVSKRNGFVPYVEFFEVEHAGSLHGGVARVKGEI